MPDQLQLRGGTTTQHASFTGASKEVTVDTTKKTVVVHDGSTAGGVPMMREDAANAAFGQGSAATPSIKFSGDTDTGIYSPGANQVAISTNGTGRLYIDAAGLVGLGTSSAQTKLHVQDSIAGGSDGTLVTLQNFSDTGGDTRYVGLNFRIGTDNGTSAIRAARTGSAIDYRTELSFWTNPTGATQTPARAMTIDYLQRVGIGTQTPGYPLAVAGAIQSDSWIGRANVATPAVDCAVFRPADNSLAFSTASSERARIDSSGRLLVGTSTARSNFFNTSYAPQYQVEGTNGPTSSLALVANSAGANPWLVIARSLGSTIGSNTILANNDGIGGVSFQASDGSEFVSAAAIEAVVDGTPGANDMPGRLVFSTTADGAASPTERMRITQAGAVLFNKTSNGLTIPGAGFIANTGGAYGEIVQSNNGVACLYLSQNFNSGTQTAVDLRFNNTQVGTINVSSSATAYNTSSDYRLKENVVSLIGAIDRVNQLQVHRFNFIADPATTVDGFIAHEAQAVVPECVTGTKDAVDADGNPQYQGIDQSKLVPLLTAALQEAIAKIKALETRLSALEGA